MEERQDSGRLHYSVQHRQEIQKKREDGDGEEKQGYVEENSKAESREKILRPGMRLCGNGRGENYGGLQDSEKSRQSEKIDSTASNHIFPKFNSFLRKVS